MRFKGIFATGFVLLLALSVFSFGAMAQVAAAPATQPSPLADPTDQSFLRVTHEDWSHLELDAASFAVLPPLVGDENGTDKFFRELVRLQWRRRDPIDLNIVRPKGVSKPPVVLYVYNYTSDQKRFNDDRFCELLVDGGYAAVGFESALSIDRLRSGRPMKQWFVSELQEALGSSVHDVQMILNYLESRGDLDVSHAAIFGQSSGGAIAILAAGVDPRLKAVDTINPWGGWSEWLANSSVIPDNERADYLKPEFLASVKMLDPVDWLPKSKAKAVRLQFVPSPVLPESSVEQLAAAGAHDTAATHFSVVRYKNLQELKDNNDGAKMYGWIKQQLRDTPSEASSVKK